MTDSCIGVTGSLSVPSTLKGTGWPGNGKDVVSFDTWPFAAMRRSDDTMDQH